VDWQASRFRSTPFLWFATLVRHREAAHLTPRLVLLVAILVTAFGLRAVGRDPPARRRIAA
jgi:hypothetical protein